jgi:hypothetical protein
MLRHEFSIDVIGLRVLQQHVLLGKQPLQTLTEICYFCWYHACSSRDVSGPNSANTIKYLVKFDNSTCYMGTIIRKVKINYLKSTVVWDLSSYSLVQIYRIFWGIFCLYLQSRNGIEANKHQDGGNNWSETAALCLTTYKLPLPPWIWRQYPPPPPKEKSGILYPTTQLQDFIIVAVNRNKVLYYYYLLPFTTCFGPCGPSSGEYFPMKLVIAF